MPSNDRATASVMSIRLDPPHGLARQPGPTWYGAGKPIVDFVLALVLLVLTAPLLIFAALLVKLTSRGPVLYSQVRLGQGGKPYRILKVRTMRHNCEKDSGACWSVPGDTRVTPAGRFLRKTHLDELPQLWNVVRGEMSLVGPRPERPEFVPQLERSIPGYGMRLGVRPGLTGLAQVQLPPDTVLESVRRKVTYDVYYIDNISLWLDLRILAGTALHVLGLPFSLSRKLLFAPEVEKIEGSYQRVITDAAMLSTRPVLESV